MQIDRVLIVHKKSLYKLYVEEHHSGAVLRAIDRGDHRARLLVQTHETQQRGLEQIVPALEQRGLRVAVRWRGNVRSLRGYQLVIAFGGDGTLLDISHRIENNTPLLGINSDPTISVGALMAGNADELPRLLDELSAGRLRPTAVTRIRLRVDGTPVLSPCLNDVLYAHVSPAEMTRYEMGVLPREEAEAMEPDGRLDYRRSSGLWIATGAGSTAAVRSAGGRVMSPGSRKLQYVIREPYIPPATPPRRGAHYGWVEPGQVLVLASRVRRGMLWADGSHHRQRVAYGQTILVDAHPQSLQLVLPPAARRQG